MSSVASKNLYELLGNTSDQDSDREAPPPTKTVDKPAARLGKRDAPKAAPTEGVNSTATRGRGGSRRGGFSGSEAAFRERATGRTYNRDQPTDDKGDTRPAAATGGRRAGGGRGGPRRGGDRHSRTGVNEHTKQAEHGWGSQTGDGEWAEEKAGDAIAKDDVKEARDGDKTEAYNENAVPTTIPEDGAVPEAEPEPEDTHKSYADYLAEQAAKKLEGLGMLEARKPNEGSKDNKKWKSAKEFVRDDEENYFKGEEKARRERDRARSAKEFVDIDYSFKEQSRDSRGGRGGGRGRGRGGGERGDRSDRGEFRGGRGRGRGEYRGESRGEHRGGGRGRGGDAPVAVNDEQAFPSLGGK